MFIKSFKFHVFENKITVGDFHAILREPFVIINLNYNKIGFFIHFDKIHFC